MPLLRNVYRVGQTLWRVPLNPRIGPGEPAKVTKVGYKWVEVKIGLTGHTTSRFNPTTMLDDPGRVGMTHRARYWLSVAEYEASLKENGRG